MALDQLVRRHVPADNPVDAEAMTGIITDLVGSRAGLRVLEIGGGRTPLLDPEQCAALDVDYWVNDISPDELRLVEHQYRTACFDIAGSTEQLPDDVEFDVIFSRSVLEHVRDSDRALSNSFRLLKPGGVMIHTFPTLYNPAFVLNKLLPERLSRYLLKRVVDFDYEKFPARYNKTTSSDRQVERLRRLGCTDAAVVPFWGHEYLHFLPPVASLEARFAATARRRDWRWYTTFAYLIGRR